MKLFVFRVGTANVDVGRILPGEPDLGARYDGPLTAFLIQEDDGTNVLVDTGVSPEQAEARARLRLPTDTVVTIRAEDNIVSRLAEVGVDTADISYVIQSHFDYDHCGGNRLFPKAKFVVQADHYAFAKRNPQRCPPGDWDLAELTYELVDGDVEVLPGIEVVSTPGHAPGHQSVVIRGLANTPTVILTGDATRTHREFEEELRGGSVDDDETIASIRKLKAIRDAEAALVITCHDKTAHAQTYRLSPACYD